MAGHAAEAGRTGVDWRHGMTFWCGFGASDAEARRQVAPVMEGLYRTPFDRFESSHAINLFDMHCKYCDVMGLDDVTAYFAGLERGLYADKIAFPARAPVPA